jgi:Flp pilus assembly protein TadG
MMLRKFLALTAKGNRRYAKSESGAAAVEFAMVALPFFMLLGVILETGIMMFFEYTLQASVQTGQAKTLALNAANFKTEICKTAGLLMDCAGKVQVYVNSDPNGFAALKAKFPSPLSVGSASDGTPGPASFVCGEPLNAVGVVATYDWNFVFPFMNFNANTSVTTMRRLTGVVMFSNEPFPVVGAPSATTC